ncbi:carboxylesterase family protein [Hirsutella rhossiliensis]|uniref:Carboxylic ester hydrolase n=1 Tax=Hirsutella rhossiliensis TaxID=111463 RepID=A0A9P8SM20_9HYPO|nr:carboxylesterase family domain-containing protein [Hirsutella rhossiliensis]KAH0965736.1 carboxylesterase family domain-containing protein [Hirsutella rhossiliensis]
MTPAVYLALALLALLPQAAGQPLASPGGGGNSPAEASRPTVTLEAGRVAGTASPAAVNRFLGVPFAAPPVRFDPPRPAPQWQGIYDASRPKPACVQKFNYPDDVRNRAIRWFSTPGPPAGESEDCLYLDVFVPAGAAEGSKAVMFWLFGGAFSFGTGSLPLYDGASFAENQDVIVVSPNYRTNVFGFPGSPEKPQSEQNLGFLDQRMALEWVQRNIRAFGGDPKRVTLFGESAGAGSVDVLVTNPPEPVPFAGAIMQSGQGSIATPNRKSADSWQKLVKAAGCDIPGGALACVRALPASRLKDIVERQALTFAPIYDGGATYRGSGRQDRRRSTPAAPGRIARVPILIGSNADEGGVFVYGQTDIQGFLAKLLPANSTKLISTLLGTYRPDGGLGPVNRQLAAILGDFNFGCPAKVVAEESAAVGIPSWRYYFNATFSNTQIFPGSGAYHSAEISLVHGTYPRAGATPYQAEVSRAMQKAWADFARDPARGPGWRSALEVAVFGAGVRPGGDDGTGQPAMALENPARIDRMCFLYKSIYDAATLT